MNSFKPVLGLSIGFLLIGCSAGGLQSSSSPGPENVSSQNIEARAAEIVEKMTLEEKVGQVLQADIASVTPEEAKHYNLGSVLNGGNSAPGGGKTAPEEDWIALADSFWTASTDTSDGGVGIPLLWGTDAVHGHNNLQSATIFPHNSALGATHNPALMREIGDVTAREIRATGLDWTFAPTLAVAQDDRWGRAYESYSENPEIVANYAKSMVEGLQGQPGTRDFLKKDNVMATAKHFIGDGGTQFGIDKGDTLGNEAELLALHGAGYEPAIDAGVQAVMASFSSINGEKMHGSKTWLTDILRGDLGFTGFVVGDWNGHAEIPGCTATDCAQALLAGVDMYMAPDSWRGLYDSLLAQVKSGEIPQARLDEAVLRILKVKIRSGLFEAGLPSTRSTTNIEVLGAEEHREIARRAVRQSLVLLKNENGLLPLRGQPTVLVTGSGADSMQQQTGGWTLNWQGDNNSNSIFETGETIFSGLEKALAEQGGQAILSPDADYTQKPDIAIVVFGEQPYAEFFGDVSDLVYEFETGENLILLRGLKDQGIPVVSVFLTGRPLWVNPHLNASDAFVVGWLPGTEGGGVADVLIADGQGQVRHDFTGRLSFSWPADGLGMPIDSRSDKGVLFPFGYGLSYGDDGQLPALPVTSGVSSPEKIFTGDIVNRGGAAEPFSLYLGDSSNANTRVESLSASSLGGLVKIKGVDYRAQEDSREIIWTGEGSVSVRSPRPIDLTQAGGNVLRVKWRLDERPSEPLLIRIGCGNACESEIDVSDIVGNLPLGNWTESEIPLACFTRDGLNPEEVDVPFEITSLSKAQISLHKASIETSDDPTKSCP
jgi:beta-glucosidase